MGQTSSKKQHRKSSMPVFNETPLPQQEKKKEQFESPRAKEVEEVPPHFPAPVTYRRTAPPSRSCIAAASSEL